MSLSTPGVPASSDPLPESQHVSRPQSTARTGKQAGPLATIFHLLRSRLRKAILVAFSLAILAGGGSFLIKPYFTATASFVPPTGNMGSGATAMLSQLSSMSSGLGSGLLGGVKSNADLYSGILKSRTVAQKLIDHFQLMSVYRVNKESLAEKVLASKTQVVIGTKDGIVTVKVTDRDPVRARDMANFYLDALRETSYGMAFSQQSQQRLFYEDRLRREKDALSDAEVALKENEEKSGLVAPVGQTGLQLQEIAQLRAQAAEKETELASLRQSEAEENPDITRLKGALNSLHAQISQMESGTGALKNESFSNAQVPALMLDYVRLERDVKYHETLFEIIAKQYEASRLNEADDPPLQILDHAVTPDMKAGPHHGLIGAIGFLLGGIFFCLWTILQATRRGEIDWSEFAE
ncbi:GumC family protein [Silvibacterium sp.]|uniref:GumC family protein n=1 Tax=Silvibacterium sp. TaxID=1964179 RepID=UPI0039E41A34